MPTERIPIKSKERSARSRECVNPEGAVEGLGPRFRGDERMAEAKVGKDHGRFEVRKHTVSAMVDWYAAERSYPGAQRFPQLTTIAMVESRIEHGDKTETERRYRLLENGMSVKYLNQIDQDQPLELRRNHAAAVQRPDRYRAIPSRSADGSASINFTMSALLVRSPPA
jgi:hypothetical protein